MAHCPYRHWCRHPLRTTDPSSAALHVVGVLPLASYALSLLRNESAAHEQRMREVGHALRRIPAFYKRHRPFLFVYGHWRLHWLGEALLDVLLAGEPEDV